MQFYEYEDYYLLTKRIDKRANIDLDMFYAEMVQASLQNNCVFSYRQSLLEHSWISSQKPYYNIYPAISPMIDKLTLDIPCSAITTPEECLCLRLPVGPDNPYKVDGNDVRTVLFGLQQTNTSPGSSTLVDGLVLLFDIGEKTEFGTPIYIFKIFPLLPDKTIEEAAKLLPKDASWNYGVQVSEELVETIVKLCCTVCLIGQDPDLISADVLSKDRSEYLSASPERKAFLEARAKRKGKNGYNLGAQLEMSPHYRRAHLATIRTGKGRVNHKVIMRKGSVVHREKISKVPSGHLDNEKED